MLLQIDFFQNQLKAKDEEELNFLEEERDREIHKIGYPSDAIKQRIEEIKQKLEKKE